MGGRVDKCGGGGMRPLSGPRNVIFVPMTKSGDWYSEMARRSLPRPTPTPAGDKPLASRSLRPRYIPHTHAPQLGRLWDVRDILGTMGRQLIVNAGWQNCRRASVPEAMPDGWPRSVGHRRLRCRESGYSWSGALYNSSPRYRRAAMV